MIKPVEVVKISKIIPIFKDGVEALNICVLNFSFSNGDECGYNVISQKGLYQIDDYGCFIQPDFCVSDLPIFESFLRPGGDEKKSKLGKNFRIRAIKFNFQFENSSNPIYSFGILLPKTEIDKYIGVEYNIDNLTDILGITKYEEPESAGSGQAKGNYPSFIAKTDEENINNLKSHVNKIIDSGQELEYSIKIDGSSWTMYVKKGEMGKWFYGICSRSQEKYIEQFYIDKYIDENGNQFHKYINPTTFVKGWYCDATSVFLTDEEIKDFKSVKVEVKDSWIELAEKSGMIEKFFKYCQNNDVQLVAKGEIYGENLRGSGNNMNPNAKDKQNLILFGIDSLETGFGIRQHYGDVHNLKKIGDELNVNYTISYPINPISYNDLISKADLIFDEYKTKGKIIEGIVVRTKYSNDLSCKILNPYYDSKK